jgi:C-terminal processing protease CtpA/Prc
VWTRSTPSDTTRPPTPQGPDGAGGGYWRKPGTYDLLDTVPALRYTRTPFLGPVYVLVDGAAFSAGAQAATWLFDTRRALVIGEEAGGDYAGPDGGATMPIVLPHAQVHVRIPMIRSLQTGQPWVPGRGVRPHVEVRPTIADLLAGRDTAMARALDLVRRGVTLERFVAGARALDDAGAH